MFWVTGVRDFNINFGWGRKRHILYHNRSRRRIDIQRFMSGDYSFQTSLFSLSNSFSSIFSIIKAEVTLFWFRNKFLDKWWGLLLKYLPLRNGLTDVKSSPAPTWHALMKKPKGLWQQGWTQISYSVPSFFSSQS